MAEVEAELRAHPRIAWRRADLPARSFERIVSLVPSLTEALFALGLGPRLVGVTAYCVEPPGAFDALPRVGGTKDADVPGILALRPDLVIANQEENTARVVRKLADAGVDVWVTSPCRVRDGAELLAELATLGAEPEAVARIVDPVLAAVEGAERRRAERRSGAARPAPRVFCAIWRDPWMSVARETYIHDLIEVCGGANVFAKSPDGRRYPIVGLEAIERAAPEVILLPSEPYAFADADREALRALRCPAVENDRLHLIDGRLVSWYGPRIAEAIRVLGPILAID